jgi:hypothetical protein
VRRLLAPIGVVIVLACAACGSGGRPHAQPAPGATGFHAGSFDELPRYPGSDPLEPTQDSGGVETRSFKADGTGPEQVVRWYVAHLEGWHQDGAVHSDHESWIGEWNDGAHVLRVTAAPAPTLGGPETVQYSLQYQPR